LLALIVAGATIVAAAGAGSGSAQLPQLKKGQIGSPRFEDGASADPAGAPNTIPFWSSSAFDPINKVTYPFTMVGANPASGKSTTVPTEIIPLNVVYTAPVTISNDGTIDVPAVQQSPIFNSSSYANTGDTAQYGSEIMRAEFSTFGNYNVNLGTPTVYPTQTITVPQNQGQAFGFLGDSLVGLAQVQWFSNQMNQMLNQLHIPTNTLPIFLVDNTYLYDGKDPFAPGACCILGYHSAGHPQGNGAGSTNGNGKQPVQTFVFASWITPGLFGGGWECDMSFQSCGPSDAVLSDIHALSHEVSEWLNDPFVNNTVQPWAVPTAQQYGCQNVLETGDPVVGIGWDQTLNGFTYHPEDEVFKSWFFRENPSTGYNGNYTFMGPANPFGFDAYPAPTC
jgi:hypothetical protein